MGFSGAWNNTPLHCSSSCPHGLHHRKDFSFKVSRLNSCRYCHIHVTAHVQLGRGQFSHDRSRLPVSGTLGTLYVWTSWSDGEAQSHSITVPSTPTTYTANYQTQYLVDYVASGCALWVTVPEFEWVNSGAGATGTFPSSVTDDAGTRCSFVSDDRPTVPPGVTAPTTVTGTYQTLTQYYLTVNSPFDTPGGQGWYDSGAQAHATLDTGVVPGNPGVRYVFTGWSGDASGAGLSSNMITMDGPKTAVANWRADATSFNGQAVSFSTSGGALQDMTPMSDSIVPQTGRPPGLIMPYGLFSFQINVPTPGASVTVTITFASTLPAGMQWWKVHGGVWVQLPPSHVSQSGNTLTITLTDGATPDDSDGSANGIISDPGGPSETPAQATQQLINLVNSMNLPHGIANGLDAKLNAALDSMNRGQSTPAKNQLGAFINEVNAQTRKNMTTTQADQLIAAANSIINALH